MKILHNCIAGYLGYYGNLEALQSQYPEGGEAGSFFLNGETSTLWMWNPVTQCWNDTNYTRFGRNDYRTVYLCPLYHSW